MSEWRQCPISGRSAARPGAIRRSRRPSGVDLLAGARPREKGRNEMAANALKINDLAKCLISRPNDFKDLRQASRNRWFRLAKDSFRFCWFWPPRSAKRNGRAALGGADARRGVIAASAPAGRDDPEPDREPSPPPDPWIAAPTGTADALSRLPDEAKKVAQRSSQSPEIIGARNIARAAHGISMPSSKRVLAIVS